MPMTRVEFENLSYEHQRALRQFADKFSLSVLTLNPDDVKPPDPDPESHWAEQTRLMAEIKSEKLRANPIKHPLPSAAEAKVLAQKLGLNLNCIPTKEMADLQALIDAGDTVNVISKFGNHADEAVRAQARQWVRETAPNMAAFVGWGNG